MSIKMQRSKRQRRKGKIYPSECRVPRIVKRGKKALLSDQRKEIEENIERDRLEISSRILEIQGNTSCKDGHNKGQKQYDLTEAEDIKKKWQEYTKELYEKYLNDLYNH